MTMTQYRDSSLHWPHRIVDQHIMVEENDPWKQDLQHQIKDTLCRFRHRLQKPMVIALVGTIGVGKSSLINSIATAMSNNRWQEHAITGHHGGEAMPMTLRTRRYPQCCRAEEHENRLMPTLLDVPGLPNGLDENWEEVLNMLFCGRIPADESLLDVLNYVKIPTENRVSRYNTTHKHLKVDRVVVVGAATEEVAENLLKTVVNAARPQQGTDMGPIPIFGVMTKYDLIDDELKETFQRREQRFKDLLGLSGAETRYLRCSTYCSDVDPGNQRIFSNIVKLDIPLLQLMTQICDPVIEPVDQGRDTLFIKCMSIWQSLSDTEKNFVYAIVGIMVCVLIRIVWKLLS